MYVSSIYVLILLFMCPHTAIYVSSYCCIWVFILLYVSILLKQHRNTCRHTQHSALKLLCRASRKCRSAPQVNPKFTLFTSTKVRSNTDANAPGSMLRACLGRCMRSIADKARAPFAPWKRVITKNTWVFGWEAASKIERLLVYDSLFFSSAYHFK